MGGSERNRIWSMKLAALGTCPDSHPHSGAGVRDRSGRPPAWRVAPRRPPIPVDVADAGRCGRRSGLRARGLPSRATRHHGAARRVARAALRRRGHAQRPAPWAPRQYERRARRIERSSTSTSSSSGPACRASVPRTTSPRRPLADLRDPRRPRRHRRHLGPLPLPGVRSDSTCSPSATASGRGTARTRSPTARRSVTTSGRRQRRTAPTSGSASDTRSAPRPGRATTPCGTSPPSWCRRASRSS